jgi:hypothetical protein
MISSFETRSPCRFDQQPGEIERPRAQGNRRRDAGGIQPKETEAVEAEALAQKNLSGVELLHALVLRHFCPSGYGKSCSCVRLTRKD